MRVLVRAPNWLGDIVMALPAIAGIRRHFSSDRLTIAGPTGLIHVVATVPGVDAFLALESVGTGTAGWVWRKHAQIIASGGFDNVILFPNSFHAAWVAKRAGVPERWGYGTSFRSWLLTRHVPRPARHLRRTHSQVDYYQDLIRELGIDPILAEPHITVPGGLRGRAGEFLERYGWEPGTITIGIAPGAAYGHAKRWPAGRFGELIKMLQYEFDATCVLVGSAGDRDAGYAIESWLRSERYKVGPLGRVASVSRVVNLIGRTDIKMLMGVLSFCRAMVSNDSGAMHLAAALGLPVTAVFGPTDERVTSPPGQHEILANPVWCRPCMLRECPIDHRCMTRISSHRVFEAVSQQVQVQEDILLPSNSV